MKYLLSILFLILIFTFFSCSSKKNNIISSNEYDNIIYPMEIGTEWEYLRELSSFNFRPDSSHLHRAPYTSTVNIRIVRQQTILDSIQTFVFHETITEELGGIFESEQYFNNLSDGLYFFAYNNPGLVIPKLSLGNKILFKGKYFNNIEEIISFIEKAIPYKVAISDTLVYISPPLQSLKYPIEIGSQWTYRQTNNPWRIDKKIIDKENVEVSAGIFECYKIHWLYDFDNNNEWDNDIIFYDYISSEGLIRRSIIIKDMVRTNEIGTALGLVDWKEEIRLTKVSL